MVYRRDGQLQLPNHLPIQASIPLASAASSFSSLTEAARRRDGSTIHVSIRRAILHALSPSCRYTCCRCSMRLHSSNRSAAPQFYGGREFSKADEGACPGSFCRAAFALYERDQFLQQQCGNSAHFTQRDGIDRCQRPLYILKSAEPYKFIEAVHTLNLRLVLTKLRLI